MCVNVQEAITQFHRDWGWFGLSSRTSTWLPFSVSICYYFSFYLCNKPTSLRSLANVQNCFRSHRSSAVSRLSVVLLNSRAPRWFQSSSDSDLPHVHNHTHIWLRIKASKFRSAQSPFPWGPSFLSRMWHDKCQIPTHSQGLSHTYHCCFISEFERNFLLLLLYAHVPQSNFYGRSVSTSIGRPLFIRAGHIYIMAILIHKRFF